MKRFAFLAILAALCSSVWASPMLTGGGSSNAPSGGPPPTTYLSAPLMVYLNPQNNLVNSATDYTPLVANGNGVVATYQSTAAYVITPVSVAGTFYQLGVYQPGWVAGTNAFTVYHGTGGGAPSATALTATVSSASEATDTTDSFTTAAPAANSCDTVVIQNTTTGWTTASQTMVSLLFTSTVGQEASISALTGGGVGYFSLGFAYGPYGGTNATEYLVSVVMPVAGTFDKLCSYVNNGPGTGNAYVITLTHETAGNCGGAANDTLLSSTIANSATYGATDLTHSEHVAAGDCVAFHLTYTGSPGTPNNIGASVRWRPDTNYQYPVFGVGTTMSQTSNGNRNYVITGSNTAGGQSAENTSLFGLVPPLSTFTAKTENFYALLSTVPDAGGTIARTFHLRTGTGTQADMNTCGGATACKITTGVTAQDATQSASVPAGNYLNVRETNTGVPASTTWYKYSFDWNVQ